MKACLPDGACEPTAQVLASVRDYIMGSIEDASLTALFGWPVYMVERAEDLCGILSFDVVNGRDLVQRGARIGEAARHAVAQIVNAHI